MKSQSRLYNHYGHVFILFILVSEGDRIAQLILERILTPEVKEVEVREERGWLVSGVLYRDGVLPGDLEYCSVNTGENTNTRSEGSRGKRRERMVG